MKTIQFLLLMISISPCVHSQSVMVKDVPEAVINAFDQAYPLIRAVDWKVKNSTHYEALWQADSTEFSATFDVTGAFIESQSAINFKDLPERAKENIKGYFQNADVKKAYRIRDADGTITYSVDVNDVNVVLDDQGNILKTTKHGLSEK